jgi:hypothetical protein
MAQPAKAATGPQRLCVVLDGTAAMSSHIGDIRKEVLETLLGYLDRAQRYMSLVEFALVVYRTRDPFSEAVVQSSSWQAWDLRALEAMLAGVQLMGGGGGESALAEALSQLLYLSTCPVNPSLLAGLPNLNPDMPRSCHALLISASASSRLPVPSGCAPAAPADPGRPLPPPLTTYKELLRALKLQHISLSTITTRDWAPATSTNNLFLYALGMDLVQHDEAGKEKLVRQLEEQWKFGWFSRWAGLHAGHGGVWMWVWVWVGV